MKMEEVAQAAGIGKGTVYEYFRSKEELMAAAIDFEFAAVEAKVTEAMNRETSMTDKLAALVATVIRHQQSQKDIVKVSFQKSAVVCKNCSRFWIAAMNFICSK